ncbi:A-kinase-interacting protein 1 [Macrotis lagotis]|uniref:A-kinase-interacting protein 1 n=1 Tax=Macrotis lagotis TaxID=92651 RepID=UPI003D6956B8
MDERPAGRLDGDSLERLCGQGRELLRRAQSGAGRWGPPGQEVEGERMNLDTAFATMVEYMDYVSSQCGKFHVLEKAALNHICRYHQRQLSSISPPQVRQKKSASYEPRESYQVPMTDQGPTKIGATPYRVDSGPLEFGPRPSRSGSGPTEFDPRTSRIDPGPSKFVSRPSKSVDRTSSKDITIEVCPGTYSVTVGSPTVTTTRMIEVDAGQIIDLSFPL